MRTSVLGPLALLAVLAASSASAQVTFYERDGFRGRAFVVDRNVVNLGDIGFNDRASSAIVERGQWEVCENAYFNGRCAVLQRGQYPSLGALGLNNRISSIRKVKGRHAPPPPPVAQYPYYPRHGERLYNAQVVAVRAVVGPPEQRCWVERQQVSTSGGPNVAGAVIGGIVGGVLGHQIGSGRGNDVATAIGAVGGAAIGSNVNRGAQTTTQDIRHCQAVPGSAKVAYWDVTYVFRGTYHRAQLAFEPGPTIPVNGRGEPRV
jgi:uncharacterized protein YcfJ